MTTHDLDAELKAIGQAVQEMNTRLRQLLGRVVELKRLRWPTKCCRCWPMMITDAGRCTCCEWDHVAGRRPDVADPDPFEPVAQA